jgi:hypothetical protein
MGGAKLYSVEFRISGPMGILLKPLRCHGLDYASADLFI